MSNEAWEIIQEMYCNLTDEEIEEELESLE